MPPICSPIIYSLIPDDEQLFPDLYCKNKTCYCIYINQPATRYTVNYDDSFVTGGIPSSILSSQALYMVPDSYDIKVMSSLGTIEIAELVVGPGGSSVNNLRSVLVTDPPDVILGQNVTIAMVVTNTGQLKINDVAPSSISVNPPGVVVGTSGPNFT